MLPLPPELRRAGPSRLLARLAPVRQGPVVQAQVGWVADATGNAWPSWFLLPEVHFEWDVASVQSSLAAWRAGKSADIPSRSAARLALATDPDDWAATISALIEALSRIEGANTDADRANRWRKVARDQPWLLPFDSVYAVLHAKALLTVRDGPLVAARKALSEAPPPSAGPPESTRAPPSPEVDLALFAHGAGAGTWEEVSRYAAAVFGMSETTFPRRVEHWRDAGDTTGSNKAWCIPDLEWPAHRVDRVGDAELATWLRDDRLMDWLVVLSGGAANRWEAPGQAGRGAEGVLDVVERWASC